MITSVFDYLKDCLNLPVETLFERLEQINDKIFSPLLTEAEKDGEAEVVFTRDQVFKIVLYILFAYSEKSDWLVLGADFQKEKESIAERVSLPEELFKKVVELSSALVRKTVVAYLDTQSSRAFRYLSFKKDMYEAAMANALLKMKDGDGNMDMKDMVDTDKFLQSLLVQIKEYEDMLRSEYKYVYDNKEEIESVDVAQRRRRDTGNVENSQYLS